MVSKTAFSIRPTSPADWRDIRDLRLEMIRDTPIAYTETLQDALAHDESEWRMRGARGSTEHGIALAAITDSGRWVGTMAGYLPDQSTGPLLVGVYVTPEFRGTRSSVTDSLLQSVEEWARTEDNRLTLHVHEDNARARRAYEKRGFAATGHSVPYNLDPTTNELEMVKNLAGTSSHASTHFEQ